MQSTVFIVPDSMISNIIRIYHNDEASRKTYQGIYENNWFPSVRKRIYDYLCNNVTMARMILIHWNLLFYSDSRLFITSIFT